MRYNAKVRKKVEKAIFWIFLICISLYLLKGFINGKKLRNSHSISTGTVHEIFTAKGINGASVRFVYSVDGIEFKGSTLLPFQKTKVNISYLDCLLRNTTLPIVYDRENHGNASMLLTTSNYEEFKVKVPDTLTNIVADVDNLINYKSNFTSDYNPCR